MSCFPLIHLTLLYAIQCTIQCALTTLAASHARQPMLVSADKSGTGCLPIVCIFRAFPLDDELWPCRLHACLTCCAAIVRVLLVAMIKYWENVSSSRFVSEGISVSHDTLCSSCLYCRPVTTARCCMAPLAHFGLGGSGAQCC